jgi:hypothetical protein
VRSLQNLDQLAATGCPLIGRTPAIDGGGRYAGNRSVASPLISLLSRASFTTNCSLPMPSVTHLFVDGTRVSYACAKECDLVVRVTGYSGYFRSLSKEYRQQVENRILADSA